MNIRIYKILIFVLLVFIPFSAQTQEKQTAFRKIASDGYYPVWSNDGSFIVYGDAMADVPMIRIVSAAGGGSRQLTPGRGHHPSLSPDLKHIAYDDKSRNGNIWKLSVSGTENKKINNGDIPGNYSSWSPNGKYIIFNSGSNIWRMTAEGGDPMMLTNSEIHDSRPYYSPDGKMIAYDSGDPAWRGNVISG